MTGVVIEAGDVGALLALPEGSVLLDRDRRVYQLHLDRSGRHWRSTFSIVWPSDAGLARRGPLQLLWHSSTPAVPGDVSHETSAPVVGPAPLDPRLVELGRRVVLRRKPGTPDDYPPEVEGVFVQWIGGEFVGRLDRDARIRLDHDGKPGLYPVRCYTVHSAPALSIR